MIEWYVGATPCCCCAFFFQAEDGIRDLVRSRGLGDVYKRQPVIASGYSGNLDFMNDASALLVDVTVVEIGEGSFLSLIHI